MVGGPLVAIWEPLVVVGEPLGLGEPDHPALPHLQTVGGQGFGLPGGGGVVGPSQMAAGTDDSLPGQPGGADTGDGADPPSGPGVPAPGGDLPVGHHPPARDRRHQVLHPVSERINHDPTLSG